MSSCVLFHGPGAKRAAIDEAARLGRLVSPPIGDDGLKVDDARHIVDLMMSVPVGDLMGVIIIGPMDEANPKASDVLLKSIEEFRGDYLQPIMWANDLGGVTMTIRSRCMDRWVNALGVDDDETLMAGSFKIVDAVGKRDYMTIVDTARAFEKREVQLLGSLAEVLATTIDNPDHRALWERLRKVSLWKNPFMAEIIVALVGD